MLPFEDGSIVAAILLKAQGLPEAEQIATKTELQQATAYLATLDNATMAPQSATVKRTTDNLQAQIDNIVRAPESGGDVGAEVYQARVGADGTNYQTLKERLDAEFSLLEDSDKGLELSLETGNDPTIENSSFWERKSFNSTTFQFESDTKRISYRGIIPFPKGVKLVISSDSLYFMVYILSKVNEDYVLINTPAWEIGEQNIESEGNYYLVISAANGRNYMESTAIYPSDLQAEILYYNNAAYNIANIALSAAQEADKSTVEIKTDIYNRFSESVIDKAYKKNTSL